MLGFEGWWGLPALPKLNVRNAQTRAYLLDVAEHWLRFGIDGWRLDVAEEIGGDYWAEFRERCRAVRPDAYLVAEIWQPKPEWLTGQQFDALMNYPLAEATLGYAAGRHLDLQSPPSTTSTAVPGTPGRRRRSAAELERLHGLYDPDVTAVMLNLLGSHDAPRARTVCGGDIAAMRIATLLQMTLPGAPCIYYGDEVGLEGEQDPYNRGAFPWERDRWDNGLRAYVRDLVGLRKRHQALRDGELRVPGHGRARLRHAAQRGRRVLRGRDQCGRVGRAPPPDAAGRLWLDRGSQRAHHRRHRRRDRARRRWLAGAPAAAEGRDGDPPRGQDVAGGRTA